MNSSTITPISTPFTPISTPFPPLSTRAGFLWGVLLLAGTMLLSPFLAPPLSAQNVGLPNFQGIEQGEGDLMIRAEQQEFQSDRNVVIFSDSVRIEHNGAVITADQVALDRTTMDAFATGNVKVTQPDGRSWTFDELTWNLERGAQAPAPQAVPNVPNSQVSPDNSQLPPGYTPTPVPDTQAMGSASQSPRDTRGNPTNPNWRGAGVGATPNPELFYPPFYITATEGRAIDRGHVVLKNAIVTTCPYDRYSGKMPEFYMSAEELDVYDGEIVVATRARFYFNDVKVLGRPKYTLDLKREATNFDLLPGYSSRDGATLKMAYTWFPAEAFSTTTHVDFRSERGFGVGQDLEWADRVGKAEQDAALAAAPRGRYDPNYLEPRPEWRGRLSGYFALDDKPYRSSTQETRERAEGLDIDEERYRLRLSHYHTLTDKDSLFVEGNYWSDEEITRDFFSREYRVLPVPENRVSLVHNERNYSLGLELNNQFNTDDFSNINRLPEVTFSSFQLPLGESGLYYDTFNSAGIYEAVFDDRLTAAGFQEFESERAHTAHTLSYPMKYNSWLNLIPRASYFGTWYGDTLGSTETTSDIVTTTDVDGQITGVTTNFTDNIVGGGSDVRNILQFDLETSFKGFKVLTDDYINLDSKGLRHVFEPYATYTYSSEPDLRPSSIFQFDLIDQLDERHDVVFGLRNKLQTKRIRPGTTNPDGSPASFVQDILDVNLSAAYEIDPESTDADPNPENLSNIFLDTEYRARDWMRIDSRIGYDYQEGEIERAENTVMFTSQEQDFVSVSHVYRPDIYNTMQASYGLAAQRRYSLYGFTRYSFEESLLEEQGILATYKNNCIGYGIGGSYRSGDFISAIDDNDEDDWKIYAQIWLLAFPNSEVALGF